MNKDYGDDALDMIMDRIADEERRKYGVNGEAYHSSDSSNYDG
jgi:hypothetical protein